MRPFDFRNEGEGYSSLLKKLGDLGPKQTTLIGMESTGHYHENLVRRLKAEGYSVKVFNPKLIAAYIKSERIDYPKTNGGDSLMIAEYLSKHPDKGSAGKSYTAEALASLSRERNALIAGRSRIYNRIQRHLDITFPELIGFLRKNADGSERNSTRGRNVLESSAVRALLEKFHSADKAAKMRDEDYEELRKASRGAFSAMRFARMKELAKGSVGSPIETDEAMAAMLCEQADLIDSQIEAVQAAQKVILHYPNWAEYCRKKLDEGKFYKVALSHVASKLLKAIWKIEHDGLEFDPAKF